MQKLLLVLVVFIVLRQTTNAQTIGIDTTTPNNRAILDVSSTTKGILAPRMTNTTYSHCIACKRLNGVRS